MDLLERFAEFRLTVVLYPAFENFQNGLLTVSGDGEDEGKAELFLVDPVEYLEVLKFFRRAGTQSRLGLLVRRSLGQCIGDPKFTSQIRMSAKKRQLLLSVASLDLGAE